MIMTDIIKRTCYICKETKPIEEFRKHSREPLGYGYECKICHMVKTMSHYLKNKERYRLNSLKWKNEHREENRARDRDRYQRKLASPRRRWAEEEINILRINYSSKTRVELLVLLPNKCPSSIKRQAQKLGLVREINGNDKLIEYHQLLKKGLKKCPRCGIVKPISEFNNPRARCNACVIISYNSTEEKEKRKNNRRLEDAFKVAYKNILTKRGARKEHDPNLTMEDALELAKMQEYKCALTGMELNRTRERGAWHQLNPSLDRIDCSKRYEIGNIRWVSIWANMSRHDWTDEVFHEMCMRTTQNLLRHKIDSDGFEPSKTSEQAQTTPTP